MKIKKEDTRLVYGLTMPIADTEGYPIGHWKEVKKIITSVAEIVPPSISTLKKFTNDISIIS